jgi:hypothetical protein
MAKRKNNHLEDSVTVRITGPNCWLGDRHYLPGETATVPADTAREWISTARATLTVAEDN